VRALLNNGMIRLFSCHFINRGSKGVQIRKEPPCKGIQLLGRPGGGWDPGRQRGEGGGGGTSPCSRTKGRRNGKQDKTLEIKELKREVSLYFAPRERAILTAPGIN
jgi:hypothetical protein